LFSKIKKVQNQSSNSFTSIKAETQNKIELEFILDKISINVFEDQINLSNKICLEFGKFNLNVNLNNYFILINFDLFNIDLRYFNITSNKTSLVFFSKREQFEKLIRMRIRLIQNEIWQMINENYEFLSEHIQTEYSTPNNLFAISEVSKTDVIFDLSNMTFNFDPFIINDALRSLIKLSKFKKIKNEGDEEKQEEENLEREDGKLDNIYNNESNNDNNKNKIKIENQQSVFPYEMDKLSKKHSKLRKNSSLENFKNKNLNKNNSSSDINNALQDNNAIQILHNENKLNFLSLEFTVNSLDIFIFNKKTNLQIFSFGLSESKICVCQNKDGLEVLLNLGNFIVSEHLNFPYFKYNHENKENNLSALNNKSNEILGLVDKNKNSSLIVSVKILNEDKCVLEDGKKIKTFVNVQVESIKLNIVYKTILRIVDCVMFDIIDSFNLENEEDKEKADKDKLEIDINKNKKWKILHSKSSFGLKNTKSMGNALKDNNESFNKEKFEIEDKENAFNRNDENLVFSEFKNENLKEKNSFENQFELLKAEKTINYENLIDFTSINVSILNPTIFLYDLYDDKRFYKLDFGKIKILNSIEINMQQNFFYSNFVVEFNEVNIFAPDNYSVCNLASIFLKSSSFEILNKKISNLSNNKNKIKESNDKEQVLTDDANPISQSIINILVSEFNIKLRKKDYLSILKIIKNNFSVDDDNDQFLFDKSKELNKSNGKKTSINSTEEKAKNKISEEKKILKFTLLLNIEVFRFQVINDISNYLEFFLIETNFQMRNYNYKDLINVTAQNIHLKDNQISIISNKKGENSKNLKNYSQLNLCYENKKVISSTCEASLINNIDVSLIDLKFFVKIDLIKFITDFLKVDLEENSNIQNISENKKLKSFKSFNNAFVASDSPNEQIQIPVQNKDFDGKINPKENSQKSLDESIIAENRVNSNNKKTNINISISNNIFFLPSEDNFNKQQILALEGDLLIDVLLTEDVFTNYFICNKEYKIDENIGVECSLQNFSFFSAFANNFESDFEMLYNKRVLIEPANFFIDFKNKKIFDMENALKKNLWLNKIYNLDIPKKPVFEKKEVLVDIDKIKLKVSYNDLFFILNTILFNIDIITDKAPKEEVNTINVQNNKKEEQAIEANKRYHKVLSKKVSKKISAENNFASDSETSEDYLIEENSSELKLNNNTINNIKKDKTNEKQTYNKYENLLELFFKFSNLEILIINDLNNMLCPIFQLILSETEATIFQDLSNTLKCNFKSEFKLNYFNYKISLWEPAIEKFNLLFLIQDKNYSISVSSQLNINLNQELIFLINNSIESLKNKYDKEKLSKEKEQEIKEVSISNNMILNYSGGEIILIRKNDFAFNIKEDFINENNLNNFIEIKIQNGEFFDLDAFNANNLLPKNLHFENSRDRESIIQKDKLIDNVIFKNRNFNLQNFSLDDPLLRERNLRNPLQKRFEKVNNLYSKKSLNEINAESNNQAGNNYDEINYQILEQNNIEFILEFKNIRKNYVFYSNFVFSNQTKFSLEVEIINKFKYISGIKNDYTINKFTTIGLRDFKQNFNLILRIHSSVFSYDYLNQSRNEDLNKSLTREESDNCVEYEIPYEKIIENEDSFLEINFKNLFFVLKIERNVLNNTNTIRNRDFSYYRLTLMPLIRIKNILPFNINLAFNKLGIIDSKVNKLAKEIKFDSEKEIDLFCNINAFNDFKINCNNNDFIEDNINLNINPDDFVNNNTTINTNKQGNNSMHLNDEKVFEIALFSFDNSNNSINKNEIILKINVLRVDGVYNFYFYSDFIIINSTDYKIYPLINKNKSNNYTELDSQEYNNFKRQNSIEFCANANKKKIKYFLTREFFKLKFLFKNNLHKEFFSDEINIIPDNYAFTGDFVLSNNDIPNEKYQIAVERVIKYVKFKNMKKIDILIIKPKYMLINNLHYDVQIGDKIIKAKTEEPICSEKSALQFKLIKNLDSSIDADNANEENISAMGNTIINSNLSDEMELDNFFENHIVLNFDARSKVYLFVKNEVKGINSIITLTQSKIANSEFIIENKTNFIIRLNQNLPSTEVDKINFSNFILLKANNLNFFNWTKINISRYLAIDLIEKSKLNKKEKLNPEPTDNDRNIVENYDTINIDNTPINSPTGKDKKKTELENNFNFENSQISDLSEKSLAISKDFSVNSIDYLNHIYSEKEITENILDTYVLDYDDINSKYKNDYNKFRAEFNKIQNVKIKVKYEGETCYLSISDRKIGEFDYFTNEYKIKKEKIEENSTAKNNAEKDKIIKEPIMEKIKPKRISQIMLNVKCINLSLLTTELQKQNSNNYFINQTQDTENNDRKHISNINNKNTINNQPAFNVKKLRKEIINIQLNEISLISITEIKNKFESNISMQFKLQSLQVDNITGNNISPYKINLFKILNKPNNTNINKNIVENLENELAFIDFIFEYKLFKFKNSKEKMHIEKIDFLIQSFGICLDSEILYEILIFIKSLQIDINETLYSKSLKDILENLVANYLVDTSPNMISTESPSINLNKQNSRKINTVDNKPLNKLDNKDYKKINSQNKSKSAASENKLYIEFLRTSPINLLLSYKNISDKFFEELNISSSIIKNIIDFFSNNENVNIKLNAVELNHIQGSSADIIQKIVKYYSKNLFYQILKLLFSIDILGNPIKLLNNFGSGVKDFFYMPIQGLRNGPLDFVMGSYSGTKSLVSHAVGGVLDSTEKITFSLKKYLLKITNSDDYNRERQSLYNRSLEGKSSKFSTSLRIIALGIKYGFRDFLFLPYFYYRNFGFLALPKGIFMGFTSLFVKPVSGCLDFLSFFSGNIAKNFLNAYDFTYKNLHRKRDTRVFWGKNKFIRSYNYENNLIDRFIEKSTLISFLKEHDKISDNIYHINDPEIVIKNVFFARKSEYDIKTKKFSYEISLIYFVNDYLLLVKDYKQKFEIKFALANKNFIKIKTIEDIIINDTSTDNTELLGNENEINKEILCRNESIKIIFKEDDSFRLGKSFKENGFESKRSNRISLNEQYTNHNENKIYNSESMHEIEIHFDTPEIKQAFLSYMFEKMKKD